ncbi:hypothetical protein ALQ33_00289 [Pseudomonas syringae pv. philadelphi]|uniref:Chalcone isomerase domain-containing protein n=1 Tax=Pseudomonas syringae pv. philadelphi TaxID=251706 RepID=A0A3M3ZTR5_9PSED|nr:chalcone isomerase family protein [Pseudomonas syringae group genomosp. 3]RMO97991.1 hypothetical protein ALQ33_00289 [Pseudomonas syringae pv. philadelphi]
MKLLIRHFLKSPEFYYSVMLLGLLLILSRPTIAGGQEYVPNSRLIGTAEFSIYGFRVYSAGLWAVSVPDDYQQPFALVLTYKRSISRQQLVDTSIEEIRRINGARVDDTTIKAWEAHMQNAFIAVEPGEQIAGVFRPGVGVDFYVNGRLHYHVADIAFTRAFFDIWLSESTRDPQLRERLMGAR